MELQSSVYGDWLGADCGLNPAAIDFLNDRDETISTESAGLDEHEQAMAV